MAGLGAALVLLLGGAVSTPKTAFRLPPRFSASVSSTTGAILVAPIGGGDSFHIESSFSIPLYISPQTGGDPANSCATPPHCPAFSNFSARAATGWTTPLAVAAAADGRGWNVSAANGAYALARRIELVTSPWSGTSHLAVSDVITAHANASWPRSKPQVWGVAAVQVRHTAVFENAGTVATGATVPGALYPFDCTTLDNSDEYKKDGLSYGAFGNPTVYMQSATSGVGLTPVDDVFLLHAVATQKAVAQQPRQPATAPACEVTSPPSVGIADLNLGVRTGETYVQEWGIYPTSEDGDYYSFINALRQDQWGAVATRLNGTGYLSMNSNLPAIDYSELQNADYTKPWGNWTAAEMSEFLALQNMHFVTTDIPYLKLSGDPCRPGEDLYCTGSCFVNELPDRFDTAMRQFAHAITAADKQAGLPPRPNLVYLDTWLTTESNAGTKYPDSRILPSMCRPEVACPQQVHGRCAAAPNGVYPLFFGTTTNRYGKQLDRYLDKALAMGYSGIYHDDFMTCEIAAYTFDPLGGYWTNPMKPFQYWDNYSVVVDPKTRSALHGAMSLVMATHEHEVQMLQRLRGASATMIYNGAPLTRTWSQTFKPSDAMYFAETSEQCRVRFMHLSTPIALLRDSSQTSDSDPKYQATCNGTHDTTSCVGANIIANLDYGVLSFLYDGLFKKGGSSADNVFTHMFPIDILRIEPHTVYGADRIITSASGSYAFAATDALGRAQPGVASVPMTVYSYLKGSLVATKHVPASSAGATLQLASGVADMAVIVRATAHSSVDAKPGISLKTDDLTKMMVMAVTGLAQRSSVVAMPEPLSISLAGDATLIGQHGKVIGQLVVPAAPSWMELAAAHELSTQLLLATGGNLSVVSEAELTSKTRPTLYIGRTKAGAKAAAGRPKLKKEGFTVFVSDGAGFLLGDDDCNSTWPHKITDNSECRRGSLFGAYALLRTLGFEWLWPGAGGQATPDLTTTGVTIAAGMDVTDAPALAMRRYRPIYSNTAEVNDRYAQRVPFLINRTLLAQLAKDESEWLLHAGMGSHDTPAWGQAFGSWWEEYGINGSIGHHPEWFALLPPNSEVNPSGVARRGPWMHDGHEETAGVKMCVSNAHLHEQVANGYVAGTPGVSACEDDGDQGFCTCDKCRAWDTGPTQGPNSTCFNHTHQDWHREPAACRGQYSDRYARFWDSVAAVLANKYPDDPPTVTGYAYDNYRNPPLNYTLKGNVMVGLVVGVFADANTTAEGQALWDGWVAKGAKKMFWRPNIGDKNGAGPSQGSVAMVDTLKWLAAHGLAATDMDSLDNHWAQRGFTYFVTARAQWHPTAYNHDSALSSYCQAGFGPRAAPIAAQYLRFWESWSTSDPHRSTVALHPTVAGTPFLYPKATLGKAQAILTKLAAACDGYRGCAAKAAFWGDGLKHARLTVAAIVARQGSPGCPADRACSIAGDGFLPTSLQLLQFRRQIASSFAVNIFAQSMAEMIAKDVTGIGAAAALEPLLLAHTTPVVQLCVNDWSFAFDQHEQGETDPVPWYSPLEPTKHGGANGTRWQRMVVGEPWNKTAPGVAWAAAHGGSAYNGVGWYRTLFPATLIAKNASRFVLVANVSGTAKAWLNGLPLAVAAVPAAQKSAGLVAWDVSGEIKWVGKGSGEQKVAIRVVGGTGGVGKGAKAEPGVVSLVFVLAGES